MKGKYKNMKKIEEVINYLEREIKKHDEAMDHLYAQVVLANDEEDKKSFEELLQEESIKWMELQKMKKFIKG